MKRNRLLRIPLLLLMVFFLSSSSVSLKAVEFDVSGPGVVNEVEKKKSNFSEEADNQLKSLSDGETNVFDYFSIPKDLGNYRTSKLPKEFKTLDDVKISIEKLGIASRPIEIHEMLFLFGWNTLTKEQKEVEINQNYLKYGATTTLIHTNPKWFDILTGATVWVSEIIERTSFYLTGVTIYIVSIASTNVVTDMFYTLGKFINDTIFDWNNPAGAGIALLVVLTLAGGMIQLLNSSRGERRGMFTMNGLFNFILKLLFIFSFTWITVSQGPTLIKRVDSMLDTFTISLFSENQVGMTSNVVLKKELFDVMQVVPYKMRVFGIGTEVSTETLEDSFLYAVESKHKDFLRKLGEGTIDFLGNTAEFFTLGAFQYQSQDEVSIVKQAKIVTGIVTALDVLLFVLIMVIVKMCIMIIVTLVSLVMIFFRIIKELSLVFSFISIIPIFFDRDGTPLKWWINRLQWSFFYMLINFILSLFIIIILKLIAFLMNTNFFFTILILVILIVSIYFTLKTLGTEGIKQLFKKMASSFKTEGTVSNMLKNVVMQGVKLTAEENPFDSLKNHYNQFKQHQNESNFKKEEDYKRGEQLLSTPHDYTRQFKDVKKENHSVDDKVSDFDQIEKEKRKNELLQSVGIVPSDELKEENASSENQTENLEVESGEKVPINLVQSSQFKDKLDSIENEEVINNENVQNSSLEETTKLKDGREERLNVTPDLDFNLKNEDGHFELPSTEFSSARFKDTKNLTPDLDEIKSVSVTDTKEKIPLVPKRKTKQEKQKLAKANVGTAIDKIDKALKEFKGEKTMPQYQNLVAIKRFVNKQEKLNYNQLRNVNAIVREAKKVKK